MAQFCWDILLYTPLREKQRGLRRMNQGKSINYQSVVRITTKLGDIWCVSSEFSYCLTHDALDVESWIKKCLLQFLAFIPSTETPFHVFAFRMYDRWKDNIIHSLHTTRIVGWINNINKRDTQKTGDSTRSTIIPKSQLNLSTGLRFDWDYSIDPIRREREKERERERKGKQHVEILLK